MHNVTIVALRYTRVNTYACCSPLLVTCDRSLPTNHITTVAHPALRDEVSAYRCQQTRCQLVTQYVRMRLTIGLSYIARHISAGSLQCS